MWCDCIRNAECISTFNFMDLCGGTWESVLLWNWVWRFQCGGILASENCGGGGGTDIRSVYGDINSRIVVAGGSGGAGRLTYNGYGGKGGNPNGGSGGSQAVERSRIVVASGGGNGGSQIGVGRGCSNGEFGIGGNGLNSACSGGGGGGGGYYGGGAGSNYEEVEEDLLSVMGQHVPRQYIQSLLLWVMDRSLYHIILLRQFTLRRGQVFHRRQLQ